MSPRRAAQPKFLIEPPIEPMLAKLAEALPESGDFLYEPKWDGFRAISGPYDRPLRQHGSRTSKEPLCRTAK